MNENTYTEEQMQQAIKAAYEKGTKQAPQEPQGERKSVMGISSSEDLLNEWNRIKSEVEADFAQ